MKRFDTPYMADWFAISLRWVMLVGLIVSLGLGEKLEIQSAWTLGLLIIWNLAMTALAGLNLRTSYHRRLNIAVDIILAGAFFWMQGGVRGPAFWAGLLPILTGSIYFEIIGSVVAAILFSGLVLYTGFLDRNNLALALVRRGAFAEARDVSGDSLEPALAAYNEGVVWLAERDPRRAVEAFGRSRRADPSFRPAIRTLRQLSTPGKDAAR